MKFLPGAVKDVERAVRVDFQYFHDGSRRNVHAAHVVACARIDERNRAGTRQPHERGPRVREAGNVRENRDAAFFRAAEDFFPESGASGSARVASPRFFAASREEVFFAGRFEGFPAFPASPRRDDSDVSVSAALPLSPKMKCVPVSPNFSAAAKPIAASARTQTKTRNFFPPLDFFCGGVFRGAVFVGLLLIGIFRKKKRFS